MLEDEYRALQAQLAAAAEQPPGTPVSPEVLLLIADIAASGATVHPWPIVCSIFQRLLLHAVSRMREQDEAAEKANSEAPRGSDSERRSRTAGLASAKSREEDLLAQLQSFKSPPFTIQRLAELVLHPRRHFTNTNKLLRALEMVLGVSSTCKVADWRTYILPDRVTHSVYHPEAGTHRKNAAAVASTSSSKLPLYIVDSEGRRSPGAPWAPTSPPPMEVGGGDMSADSTHTTTSSSSSSSGGGGASGDIPPPPLTAAALRFPGPMTGKGRTVMRTAPSLEDLAAPATGTSSALYNSPDRGDLSDDSSGSGSSGPGSGDECGMDDVELLLPLGEDRREDTLRSHVLLSRDDDHHDDESSGGRGGGASLFASSSRRDESSERGMLDAFSAIPRRPHEQSLHSADSATWEDVTDFMLGSSKLASSGSGGSSSGSSSGGGGKPPPSDFPLWPPVSFHDPTAHTVGGGSSNGTDGSQGHPYITQSSAELLHDGSQVNGFGSFGLASAAIVTGHTTSGSHTAGNSSLSIAAAHREQAFNDLAHQSKVLDMLAPGHGDTRNGTVLSDPNPSFTAVAASSPSSQAHAPAPEPEPETVAVSHSGNRRSRAMFEEQPSAGVGGGEATSMSISSPPPPPSGAEADTSVASPGAPSAKRLHLDGDSHSDELDSSRADSTSSALLLLREYDGDT